MIKIKYFLSIVLLLAVTWSTGHSPALANVSTGDEIRPVHVSERIKIVRPQPVRVLRPQPLHEEPVNDVIADEIPDTEPEPAETKTEMAEDHDDSAMGDIIADLQVDEVSAADDLYALGIEDRYYNEAGRVDPFAPFLRIPEPAKDDAGEAGPIRRTPRTPLETMQIGQLKLTAVVKGENMLMAMVEDSTGKGYILRMGTYVGDNGGRVSSILENRVIVEEPHRDVFGKTSIREVELQIQRTAGE